ncbi:16S rRNA (guanine(527)-N(7))-methyltransferase RsmG [Bacillus sp. NEB1478]|uniref:16S rRNA (guanine(527)-N(7))-methyltransferase RsmG n=1 Tax=Bacillus sp. NEB1478 TaxID=3073816 RepID=UPI002873A64D|nr:16S rRNA (guanine(527)-N(7))-methyltransferase RsmG [Bacillus sp. NEB1478]WNB92090.1 16S rRNA (guanine(527)-N(7))-methyltransferase RsmG [Bacillus sp. NEB1478]
MNIDMFQSSLDEKGIVLSEQQLKQFETYYELLVEWNEKMNLTAITEKEEVYLKHFYDSVTAGFHFNFQQDITVCDVGAGAGFPAIPLKICFPEIRLTVVDSLNKRIGFLQHVVNELGLKHVTMHHDRAETFAHRPEFREQFDLVMARAVARLSVLSELCLPLVKKNGHFLAMKGANLPEEVKDGEKAVKLLGGKIKDVHSFLLPIEESERNIVIIDKVKETPKKFPRKPGTPNKSPIQ